MFGGRDTNSTWVDDTWVYDLSTNTWTQKNPSSKPSARYVHAMAYIGGDQALLFGGLIGDYPGTPNSDTWVYDLSENSWTQKHPDSHPSARGSHAMAYIGGDKVLLFGGHDGASDDETWVYHLSDNTWTQDMNVNQPSARYGHGLSETSMDGSSYLVLFGGYDGSSNYDDTWTYELSYPECQIVNRLLWKDIGQVWFASGIDVQNGDRGVITVQGFSNADPQGLGWQGWVGPGGYPEYPVGQEIIPDAPFQSVIYKIGENGTAHYLGTGGSTITFDADGELLFGINNDNPENSDGAFLFTVVLEGECPADVGVLGDVSGNKQVTAYDAALILQYCVGLIDRFPIQEMSAAKRAVPAIYELRIPNSSVKADELIRVPITINNGDNLTAGAFKIKYDASVLRAVAITPRPMLNGAYWQSRINEQIGEIRFAFAKSSPTKQSDDAALALLEFESIGDVEGMTTDLVFHDVQIAESISIKNINGSITFLPRQSSLFQNYPNPFNPETWIPFHLAETTDVSISIYDIGGKLIRLLYLGEIPAGVYVAKERAAYWDGRNATGEKVSSGVYFYHLEAGDYSATRRMLILK